MNVHGKSHLRRLAGVRSWPLGTHFIVLNLVFVLSAGAAGLYVHMQTSEDSRAVSAKDASFAASTAAKRLGDYLAAQTKAVDSLAANPLVGQVLVKPAGCSLNYSGLGGPDASHLDIIAANGTIACSSLPPGPSKQSGYRGAAWLRRALAAPLTLAPILDARTGKYVALYARPIADRRGVVAGFSDLSSVGSMLATQYGDGHEDEFLVTSPDGLRIIARSIGASRWIGKPLHGMALAARGHSFEAQDINGTTRLYEQTRVPGTGWRLLVGDRSGAVFAAGDRLQNPELGIIAAALLIVLVATWLIYRNLALPIRRLSRGVSGARLSGQPIAPVRGPTEITSMADEFRRLIATLHTSSEEYRRLFESNPNPMWVYDTNTLRFLAVNEAATERYGYTREEFLTMTMADIRSPEDGLALREYLRHSSTSQRRLSQAGLWRHLRKNGTAIDVEVTSHDHDFEGRSARVVNAIDVTERMQTEDALLKSEARYRDLFENATDLIATTDLDGRLTDVNRAFLQTLDYTRRELIGKPILELVPVEQHERLRKAEHGKRSHQKRATVYEHCLVAKNGNRIQVEVASRLLEADGQPIGIEAICRDLSDRARADTLERQLQQAQRLESVGRLAGGIAHDFNNLLTVISGYTEVLLEDHDPTSAIELGEIAAAAQRATTLTQQLLAFSRRQVLQPRVIDLNEIVRSLTPMLTRLIGEHIELTAPLDPDLKPVLADPGQIEQILVNLVVNARDAMPHGGRLTIETGNTELDDDYVDRHPEASAGPHAMLAVTDTGVGMTQEILAQVFEPFFTTKPIGTGTGLGLSTVYGIVKQSGGAIWIYSEPGRGSSFKVYLPITQAPSTIEPHPAPSTPAPNGTETILLAEDEPALRTLTSRMLTNRGYNVIAAETPKQALQLAKSTTHTIDLLLTDLVMPQMDGHQLANQINRQIPGLRILYMSGYADQAIIADTTLDLTPFLEKPFTAADLATKVRETLDTPRETAHPTPA